MAGKVKKKTNKTVENNSRKEGAKPGKKAARKTRIDRHKDGSVRAKGTTRGGKLDGYWEWFRLDGTIMRSGHFEMGKQAGEWTTYDAKGKVYKVTRFK